MLQEFYVSMINMNSYSINAFKNATKPVNPRKLSIYYYNDTHGNSDLMAGIVNGAKQFKKQSLEKDSVSFVLSAGDNYSGADIKKNNFIVNLMQNIMGVDLSAVGNHEIDGGIKGLADVAKNKKVQFVATNVILPQNTSAEGVIKKSVIKEQKGVKYGFVGAMPIDFMTCTKEENLKDLTVMDFNQTIEALQNEINNLRAQGINKIVLLSHSGYEKDKEYAKNLDGVDIIVGGHTHTVVDGTKEGENIVRSKSGEPVLIVQAGENGKYYGTIEAEFDEDGVLKAVENVLTESTNKNKSPILEYIKEENLGKSPKVGVISEIEPLAKNRRIATCAWTNAVADSMRSELNTQIALINAANIRKVPQAGILTERDIQESAPMKNKLMKTKITQKQLTEAIKAALKRTFENKDGVPGILIASGLTYKADDKGNLLELNFVENDGKKTPIDINNPSEDVIYTLAYDNFVAKKDGEYPELYPQFETEQLDYDKDTTMINYLKKLPDKENLKFIDDKRIEIQKTSQQMPQGNNNRSFLDLTSPKAS